MGQTGSHPRVEGTDPPITPFGFERRDEGMMDSGEWLEELRSGFGFPSEDQGRGASLPQCH